MSWSDALKFSDDLTARGIKLLVLDGDRFRSEPQGVLNDQEKAEVSRLRSWLLCNAILNETTRRIAGAKNAARAGTVARAKQIAAEEEIDRATIAGEVAATRRACAELLNALGITDKESGKGAA